MGLAIRNAGWISLGERIVHPVTTLGAVASLAVVTQKYRRGDPVARRQIRWVAVGAYCALLPIVISTVNRYTETVSRIVREHGGSVVEFNGDGMMAVFGAPGRLADKERAAVEAGREIVVSVGALPIEGSSSSGEARLAVGVGIATGEAFVGSIRAVDRMIWSAIGNTTNLAARLQGLTRELDATLVIDSETWRKAQRAAADFEKRPDVPIRGRRDTRDVYALPLRSSLVLE